MVVPTKSWSGGRRSSLRKFTIFPMMGIGILILITIQHGKNGGLQTGGVPGYDHGSFYQRTENYAKIPMHFEVNRGQAEDQVKFLSRGKGYTLSLTSKEAVLSLRRPETGDRRQERKHPESRYQKSNVIRMKLVGGNPNPEVVGLDELPGKSNYFRGGDPNNWYRDIPNFARVKYADVYPGIDLVYYGNEGKLEYDFIVSPGVDPRQIQIDFDYPESIDLNLDHDLTFMSDGFEATFRAPIIYQASHNGKNFISGKFVQLSDNCIGFDIADYDASKPLTIDPALVYSTYWGGEGRQGGYDIALDGENNAYIVGITVDEGFSNYDVFVFKINASGSEIVYSTIIGGEREDKGYSIAVDEDGNAHIAGETYGDFPLKNPYDDNIWGGASGAPDGFVTKLNASGNDFIYSTYLGGYDTYLSDRYGSDRAFGIALDKDGLAYVTGETDATNFPTTKDSYNEFGGPDPDYPMAFITKFDAEGDAVYSTYVGPYTAIPQYGYGITVDLTGCAYITGQSQSYSSEGGTNAFIAKFNEAGSGRIYYKTIGGSDRDRGNDIRVDDDGYAYVTGVTVSEDFPTVYPLQSTFGGMRGSGDWYFDGDAFVARLDPEGSDLVFSSFLGGSSADYGDAIALDPSGNVYITGTTYSGDFPTLDAYQNALNGITDAFVTKINNQGVVEMSTYLGGSAGDPGRGIAVDAAGLITITGSTGSQDFPLKDAIQDTKEGLVDAFIVQLGPGGNDLIYDKVVMGGPPVFSRTPTTPQQILPQYLLHSADDTVFFKFQGRSSDDRVGLRVLNTQVGPFDFPPLNLSEHVTITDPDGETILGTTIYNIGAYNFGEQFMVSKDGEYTISVSADPESHFPAPFQIHLSGNVGLPTHYPRGTRLDILVNHPAPRPQGIYGKEDGIAQAALFKFANPIIASPYPVAVLVPPGSLPAGLWPGQTYKRADDPMIYMDITTPTARTPVVTPGQNPTGLVIDFTQLPDPAVIGSPPSLAGTVGAVIGETEGTSISLLQGGLVSLIMDMGWGQEIVDGEGNDFRVVAQGSYAVAASNTPFGGTFIPVVGSVSGTRDLDLSVTGLTSARYILVMANPAVTLDGIKALNVFSDYITGGVGPMVDYDRATMTMRRAKAPETSLDPFLEIIGPDGARLGDNDSGYGDETSQNLSDVALIDVGLNQQGFYRYIGRGYHWIPDPDESFGVFFTHLESGGEWDRNEIVVKDTDENMTQAQKVGLIEHTHERDSYIFKGKPGETLHIVVNALDPGLNPLVELYDPEEFLIGANDDREGHGRNALLTVTLPTMSFNGNDVLPNPSTYRIVVYGLDVSGIDDQWGDMTVYRREVSGGNYELKVFRGALAVSAPPAPVVTDVTPARAIQGATDLDVIINGGCLTDGLNVFFSGTGLMVKGVDLLSSLQVKVTVDISEDAAPGLRNVTVVNGDGKRVTKEGAFEVRESLGDVTVSWDAPSGGWTASPTNVTAFYGGVPQTGKVRIQSVATALQSYNIYRSDVPDARISGVLAGTVPAGTTTFTDQVPHDGNHYYQATAVYDTGESDPSNEAVVHVDPLVGNIPIVPVVDGNPLAGEEFWVDIVLGDDANPAVDLFGLSLSLQYTQTDYVHVLTPHAINVIPGDFMGSDVVFFPVVDETGGKVSAGITRKAGQSGVNGSGTVLRVKFETEPNTPDGTVVQFTITEKTANDAAGSSFGLYVIGKTVNINNALALPTFHPSPGTYNNAQNVTISCATSGVTIRYTTDGSEPTESSQTYTIPIPVNETSVLKARAYRDGWPPSAVAEGMYTILQTGVDGAETAMPETYILHQNYPNPFNPATTISYAIPQNTHAQRVTLEIYNTLGEKVKILVDQNQAVGRYTVQWHAVDEAGRQVSGGVYLYRLSVGSFVDVKKMLLVR